MLLLPLGSSQVPILSALLRKLQIKGEGLRGRARLRPSFRDTQGKGLVNNAHTTHPRAFPVYPKGRLGRSSQDRFRLSSLIPIFATFGDARASDPSPLPGRDPVWIGFRWFAPPAYLRLALSGLNLLLSEMRPAFIWAWKSQWRARAMEYKVVR